MKIKDIIDLDKHKKKNRFYICSARLSKEMHKELSYYYELITNQVIDELGEMEIPELLKNNNE